MSESKFDKSARAAARERCEAACSTPQEVDALGFAAWARSQFRKALDELDRRDEVEAEQARRIAELEAKNLLLRQEMDRRLDEAQIVRSKAEHEAAWKLCDEADEGVVLEQEAFVFLKRALDEIDRLEDEVQRLLNESKQDFNHSEEQLAQKDKRIAELTSENGRLEAELVCELRSLLCLANAYCANSTARYAQARLDELEQDEAKKGGK